MLSDSVRTTLSPGPARRHKEKPEGAVRSLHHRHAQRPNSRRQGVDGARMTEMLLDALNYRAWPEQYRRHAHGWHGGDHRCPSLPCCS